MLYVRMYKYHGSAQVTVLDTGYQSCIYSGFEGGASRVRLLATGGHGVLLCAYIQYCISVWGEPDVGSPYLWPERCGQGGNEG